MDRGGRADPFAIRALVDLILLSYARAPEAAERTSSGAASARTQRLVAEVQEVIDRRFAGRLSLADIAVELSRSSSSLTRAARSVTGHSVLQLITERRIGEARRLLTETELSVSEIAWRVGYSNVGHFHGAFRRSTSMTPRRWREQSERLDRVLSRADLA